MAIGVIDGVGFKSAGGGVVNVEGTETLPKLGVVDGDGVGVAVDTRTGDGTGVALGLGSWPYAISAMRDVTKANPKRLFRMRG